MWSVANQTSIDDARIMLTQRATTVQARAIGRWCGTSKLREGWVAIIILIRRATRSRWYDEPVKSDSYEV